MNIVRFVLFVVAVAVSFLAIGCDHRHHHMVVYRAQPVAVEYQAVVEAPPQQVVYVQPRVVEEPRVAYQPQQVYVQQSVVEVARPVYVQQPPVVYQQPWVYCPPPGQCGYVTPQPVHYQPRPVYCPPRVVYRR